MARVKAWRDDYRDQEASLRTLLAADPLLAQLLPDLHKAARHLESAFGWIEQLDQSLRGRSLSEDTTPWTDQLASTFRWIIDLSEHEKRFLAHVGSVCSYDNWRAWINR